MMGPCPVVRILWPANAEYGGFVEINESDFDPKVHALFDNVLSSETPTEPVKRRGRKPRVEQ